MDRKKQNLGLIVLLILVLAIAFYLQRPSDDTAKQNVTSNISNTSSTSASTQNPNYNEPLNLLKNGNFEDSLNSWNQQAGIFWSANSGKNKLGALLINAPQLEDKSKFIYAKSASQCVRINGGSSFAVKANFRYLDTLPDRASVNRIHVYWYDGLNCKRGGQYGDYLEPKLEKDRWQAIQKHNLIPSLGANSVLIKIEQSQRGNNNSVAIWDNVVLLETRYKKVDENLTAGNPQFDKPLGENYLLNATFNTNIEQWQSSRLPYLQWRPLPLSDNAKNGVMASTLENKRTSSMNEYVFKQCVNIGTNERYEFGAKVKIASESNQRGGGRLRATWYENENCKGRYRAVPKHIDVNEETKNWQTLHVNELTPPKGANSVNISFLHSIDGQGKHVLLWDDLFFRGH